MLNSIIDLLCFTLETMKDVIFISALIGRKFRDMRHPIIGTAAYLILGNTVSLIFPNAFGWLALCLLSYLMLLYIMKTRYFYVLMAYILEYLYAAFLEDIIIMGMTRLGANNETYLSISCAVFSFLISVALCRYAPMNHVFQTFMGGSGIIKFLSIHLYVVFMIETGLYKFSTIDTSVYIPVISCFAVVVILSDIIILGQQRTIGKQQHDLECFKTYQPMMADLIKDLRSKQHDFDNHLTAVRMLPYTYRDYESLKNALINYSDNMVSEYRESELLRINLSVVAGFIYSKMINAEKNGKTLNVIVRQHTLKSCMPEYEIIRILGILIDNALEAGDAPGSATLSLDSSQNQIIISTMNKGPVLSSDLRRNMFTYGYTTKTIDKQHHGYGLPNMKKLVDEYEGKICLDNRTISGQNYICFEVTV